MMMMIEKTRIMDRIFMKYKIRIVQLMHATKEYDLENDPDVIALTNANA